jgi:hypothetical protein
MKKNFILTSSFAEEIEQLEQGLEIKSIDGNPRSTVHTEWFELKDEKTNYTYEYTLYIDSDCTVISENVKYKAHRLCPSIYQIRSRQLVSIWKPLLEKQLRQSKKFRIKYVMNPQKYEIVLAPLFLETLENYVSTTWNVFVGKNYEYFIVWYLLYSYIYAIGIFSLEKNWLGITVNVLATLPFFYLSTYARVPLLQTC